MALDSNVLHIGANRISVGVLGKIINKDTDGTLSITHASVEDLWYKRNIRSAFDTVSHEHWVRVPDNHLSRIAINKGWSALCEHSRSTSERLSAYIHSERRDNGELLIVLEWETRQGIYHYVAYLVDTNQTPVTLIQQYHSTREGDELVTPEGVTDTFYAAWKKDAIPIKAAIAQHEEEHKRLDEKTDTIVVEQTDDVTLLQPCDISDIGDIPFAPGILKIGERTYLPAIPGGPVPVQDLESARYMGVVPMGYPSFDPAHLTPAHYQLCAEVTEEGLQFGGYSVVNDVVYGYRYYNKTTTKVVGDKLVNTGMVEPLTPWCQGTRVDEFAKLLETDTNDISLGWVEVSDKWYEVHAVNSKLEEIGSPHIRVMLKHAGKATYVCVVDTNKESIKYKLFVEGDLELKAKEEYFFWSTDTQRVTDLLTYAGHPLPPIS